MTDTQIMAGLAHWGCDTDGARRRMLQDTAFYLGCLSTFCRDTLVLQLGEQLRAGDARAAFETAHALKGVSGNLGLTPLYRAVCALVEPLRQGSLAGTDALYQIVLAEHAAFLRCMGVA